MQHPFPDGPMSRLATVLCLAALLIPASVHAQDTTKQHKIKRNPDLITSEEVEATSGEVRTAYDLVKQLRPIWLQSRGVSSIRSQTPDPQVYVGGVHRGGSARLEDVPKSSIREIQHLRGTDATQRYGMGHESGAILVTLK